MMVLKNTIFQATGQAGSKALVFCLFVYLARSLSVESFGQFNFIYAYVAVFGIFMDFGLDLLVTKLIAISPMNLKYIFSIFKFKIICIVTVLTLYVVINWGFRNINSPTIYILAVIGTALYSFITFIYGIYRGKEVLRYEALFAIIHKFIFLLLSILFVHYGFSIAGVFSALVFASVIVLVWLGYDVLMRYGALIICRNILKFKDITNIIKESLPFLVINLCTIIYFRVDTLMLSYLKSNYDVGIYNAAYRLMEGMIFIPGAFMTAYFPVLVRASNSAISSLVEKFKVGLFTLIIMGIFISGVLFAGSNTFIVFFLGATLYRSCANIEIVSSGTIYHPYQLHYYAIGYCTK